MHQAASRVPDVAVEWPHMVFDAGRHVRQETARAGGDPMAEATQATQAAYSTSIPVAEELRGSRVVLRRHRASDAADLLAALEASRERLAPWLRFPDPLRTIEATRDWLIRREAAWLLRDVLSYAIRHGATNAYLGSVELHHIAWEQ